jgi:hypothetical protein
VLCPASLLDNWRRETEKTLRHIQTWVFHDGNRSAAYYGWQANGGILLTTYRQAEHLLAFDLPPVGWAIVDEAHNVKNPSTKSATWTRRVEINGTSRPNPVEIVTPLPGCCPAGRLAQPDLRECPPRFSTGL